MKINVCVDVVSWKNNLIPLAKNRLVMKLLLDHSVLQINKNNVFYDKHCINVRLEE